MNEIKIKNKKQWSRSFTVSGFILARKIMFNVKVISEKYPPYGISGVQECLIATISPFP